MYPKSLLAALLCLFSTIIFAQTESVSTLSSVKSVYGEIGGPGLFSVNYDQRFKGNKGLGFRIGVGGIGFLNSGVFTLPFGLNYLNGSNSHYLELGAGLSALTVSDGEIFESNESTIIGYFNAGYRYQPEKKGFTARVFLSPLITPEGLFPFYGGISVGFRF